jgi:AraC-like DNA-binding protein
MRTARLASPARGVLGGTAGGDHQRILPSPELAPYIAHFWWVSWDLATPVVAETLPHPTIHLVFEIPTTSTTTTTTTTTAPARTRATLHGVPTRRFSRTLRGRGRAFGIKLRPAALRAFTRTPAASAADFTDRRAPISDLFGRTAATRALTRALCDATTTPTITDAIALAEPFLLARATPLLPHVAALRDLVERIEHDHTIRRAAHAARILGCDERALQRRFHTHVGVGAKAVIQRYRLMEAVEQLKPLFHSNSNSNSLSNSHSNSNSHAHSRALAALAADLGYADQAHFSRDFAAVIGQTPRAYAAATRATARNR